MRDERRILERDWEAPGFLSEMEFPGPLTLNRLLSLLVAALYLFFAFVADISVATPFSLPPRSLQTNEATPESASHRQQSADSLPVDGLGRKIPRLSLGMRIFCKIVALCLPLFLIWYPEVAAPWAATPRRVFGATCDSMEGLQPRAFPIHTIFIQILGWLILVGIPLLMIVLSINVGP